MRRIAVRELHRAPVPGRPSCMDGLCLEVGCGNGRLLRALPPGSVGVDSSASMLAEAARRAPAGRLVRAEAERLPFRRGAFAAVLCVNTVHACAAPASVLEEIYRLAPARFVLDARNMANPVVGLRYLARRGRIRIPYPPRFTGAWSTILRRAGWMTTRVTSVPRPISDAGEGFRGRHLLGAILSRVPGLAPCQVFTARPLDSGGAR